MKALTIIHLADRVIKDPSAVEGMVEVGSEYDIWTFRVVWYNFQINPHSAVSTALGPPD